MERVARVSVTIPRDVLNRLEKVMKNAGIRKRSHAISKAIELFIDENMMLAKSGEDEGVGTINYIYEHGKELVDKLLDLQHEHSDVIISTLHVHLDLERCFETLVVRGRMEKIRKLINSLVDMKLKDVSYKIL
ncbi:MAG: nickel-responsive transcriptional regulator NikR [Nitrososphaeria archaeon]|nr:nickel-responsive transcriptional regulator NikR [Nitrososphaeria archaeon]